MSVGELKGSIIPDYWDIPGFTHIAIYLPHYTKKPLCQHGVLLGFISLTTGSIVICVVVVVVWADTADRNLLRREPSRVVIVMF